MREKHTISSSFTTIGPWYEGSQSYTMIFELVHWVLVLTVDGHPGVCDHEVQPVILTSYASHGMAVLCSPRLWLRFLFYFAYSWVRFFAGPVHRQVKGPFLNVRGHG